MTAAMLAMQQLIQSLIPGVKITSVYDMDDAKFAEAYKYGSRFMNSFHDVPGFTFSIEVCLAPDEVIETIKDVVGMDIKQKGS
jgi:anionic cell wall polymer biosynthesis LytR-Cps2A-Psr (LCP) family protein